MTNNTTHNKCPPGKIMNPVTGRCVKRGGATGQKLIQGNKIEPKTKQPSKK